MRIIIAGSRTFKDYNFLKKTMDKIAESISGKIVVLSGHSLGADRMGDRNRVLSRLAESQYVIGNSHAAERGILDDLLMGQANRLRAGGGHERILPYAMPRMVDET